MTDGTREEMAGPRCPTCARRVAWPDNPTRPFCSLICRLIDLGRWLDGGFRVPGTPLSLSDLSVEVPADE